MSGLTFDELTQQVFSFYNQRDYAQAYKLATQHAARFPEMPTAIPELESWCRP